MPAVDASTPAVVLKLGAQGALGAVRTLGRLGVDVYAAHAGGGPVAASRYLRGMLDLDIDGSPPPDRLVEYGERIGGRPLLVATDDVGALYLDDHREALRTAFRFPEQPPGLPRELYSKEGMYRVCTRLGVPTPKTEFPQSRADVEAFVERASFPVVLKPVDAWRLGRRGGAMEIVQDADQLLGGYDRMEDPDEPNLMLQEYIPGGPDSVWMFNGYFDADSECLVSFTGRKLRQHPADTGMTSLGICLRNDDVERATKDLMKRVGYRGVLDIGWRFDARDGEYKLLDVNPRLGNTFRLFVGTNGIDVLRAMYLDLTDRPVPPTEWREGRKWLVEPFDLRTGTRYLRERRLTPRSWARSLRGVEETAWWARDDPKPFLALAGEYARKLVP